MTLPQPLATAPPPWITALILAGGNSARMGQDKALLPWQGVPLIQRVSTVAGQCCSRVAVLTPWPEQYQPLLPETVGWLPEFHPHEGPLMALQQGFQLIYTPWVLLLACDLPCLDPALLQAWITQLPVDPPPEQLAYVPRQSDHRWEPMCGFYHQDCRLHLASFVAAGGRSFQGWLSELPAQPLPIDAPVATMLRNCNTPQDLPPPASISP